MKKTNQTGGTADWVQGKRFDRLTHLRLITSNVSLLFCECNLYLLIEQTRLCLGYNLPLALKKREG